MTEERDWGAYWDERARARGLLAVGHVAWDEDRLKVETAVARYHLDRAADKLGLLDRMVPEPRPIALDFGCGVGRFTPWLRQRLGHSVCGVDVSPAMRAFARAKLEAEGLVDCWVDAPLQLGCASNTDFFDLVFTFTVLQHIPDSEIERTAAEITRVAKPGARVLLVENIHSHHVRRTSNSGHVVFRAPSEYVRMFPGTELLQRFMIEGEEHAIFGGRLVRT